MESPTKKALADLESQMERLIQETDEESSSQPHPTQQQSRNSGPIISYQDLFGAILPPLEENNNNNNNTTSTTTTTNEKELVRNTDSPPVRALALDQEPTTEATTTTTTTTSLATSPTNTSPNLFTLPPDTASGPKFSFEGLSPSKEQPQQQTTSLATSPTNTSPNLFTLPPDAASAPKFSFEGLSTSKEQPQQQLDQITTTNSTHNDNESPPISSIDIDHDPHDNIGTGMNPNQSSIFYNYDDDDDDDMVEGDDNAAMDDSRPRRRASITTQRVIGDGIYEEEEIVFVKEDPDTDTDYHDDDDDPPPPSFDYDNNDDNYDDDEEERRKVVQFTGLPENPPELTMESFIKHAIENTSQEEEEEGEGEAEAQDAMDVGNDDKVLNDHDEDEDHEPDGGHESDDDEGEDDDEEDDEEEDEEEDEEDDDTDSSVETPPIPPVVSHDNEEQDHSSYDEALEYSGSEESSSEEDDDDDEDDDYEEGEEDDDENDDDGEYDDDNYHGEADQSQEKDRDENLLTQQDDLVRPEHNEQNAEVDMNKDIVTPGMGGNISTDGGNLAGDDNMFEMPGERETDTKGVGQSTSGAVESTSNKEYATGQDAAYEKSVVPLQNGEILATVVESGRRREDSANLDIAHNNMTELQDGSDFDIENQSQSPEFIRMGPKYSEQIVDNIPEQKPDSFDETESSDDYTQTLEGGFRYLVIALVCCTLAAAIAIPVIFSRVDNDRLPSTSMPFPSTPTTTSPPTPFGTSPPVGGITPQPTVATSAPTRNSQAPSQPPFDVPVSPPMSTPVESIVPTPPTPTGNPTFSGSVSFVPTSIPDPPENDYCQSAIGPLIVDGSPTLGTIVSATVDEVDRCGDVTTNGPGVWYYTLGTGGEMMAHTCLNTYFDSKITIFKDGCEKPLCLEASEDFCGSGGSLSAVSWQSEFRQEYYILVHGEPDFVGNGEFELSVLGRYNDECTTAIGPLSVHQEALSPSIPGNTLSANPNEIDCEGEVNTSPSVFYLVHGTGGTLTASVCQDSDFDARITVLTGSCADALSCVRRAAIDDCSVSWESVAFQQYYVMVHGNSEDDIGNFELTVFTEEVPDNDSCHSALGPIPLDGTIVEGTTAGAELDSDVPFCVSAATSPGVWYYATGDGSTLQASLCDGSSFDTRISIYEGDCSSQKLSDLVCVEGNDDFCGTDSLVTWSSVVGTNYLIFVHGYQNGVGDFKLSVKSI